MSIAAAIGASGTASFIGGFGASATSMDNFKDKLLEGSMEEVKEVSAKYFA